MLNSFSMIFSLSAIAALVWLGWAQSENARRGVTPVRLMAAGLAALMGGLSGARFVYVALHISYFQNHLVEILALWTGGLSGVGGLIGTVAGIWVFARGARAQFWDLADALSRPAAAMSAAIWAGCWMTGCAYGLPVEWGIVEPDIFGRQQARWPATLMAALATAVWVFILPWIETRFSNRGAGLTASLTMAWVAITMLVVSLLRADPTILYGGIRQETLGAASVLLLASIALIFHLRTEKGVQP